MQSIVQTPILESKKETWNPFDPFPNFNEKTQLKSQEAINQALKFLNKYRHNPNSQWIDSLRQSVIAVQKINYFWDTWRCTRLALYSYYLAGDYVGALIYIQRNYETSTQFFPAYHRDVFNSVFLSLWLKDKDLIEPALLYHKTASNSIEQFLWHNQSQYLHSDFWDDMFKLFFTDLILSKSLLEPPENLKEYILEFSNQYSIKPIHLKQLQDLLDNPDELWIQAHAHPEISNTAYRRYLIIQHAPPRVYLFNFHSELFKFYQRYQ